MKQGPYALGGRHKKRPFWRRRFTKAQDRSPGADFWIWIVTTRSNFRRAYSVDQRPIKAICEDFGLSPKVTRKILLCEVIVFESERRAQPKMTIGYSLGEFDRVLPDNKGKALRERLTLIRVQKKGHGLENFGGKDAARRDVNPWAREA